MQLSPIHVDVRVSQLVSRTIRQADWQTEDRLERQTGQEQRTTMFTFSHHKTKFRLNE